MVLKGMNYYYIDIVICMSMKVMGHCCGTYQSEIEELKQIEPTGVQG